MICKPKEQLHPFCPFLSLEMLMSAIHCFPGHLLNTSVSLINQQAVSEHRIRGLHYPECLLFQSQPEAYRLCAQNTAPYFVCNSLLKNHLFIESLAHLGHVEALKFPGEYTIEIARHLVFLDLQTFFPQKNFDKFLCLMCLWALVVYPDPLNTESKSDGREEFISWSYVSVTQILLLVSL